MNSELLLWIISGLTSIIALMFGGLVYMVKSKVDEIEIKINNHGIQTQNNASSISELTSETQKFSVKINENLKSISGSLDAMTKQTDKIPSIEIQVGKISTSIEHQKEQLSQFGRVILK